MVSQCFERAPSRPCGVAAGAAGVAAAGAELAPELPCCWEDWAKLARGNASMAASTAKRDMVFMVSPWLRLLERAAKHVPLRASEGRQLTSRDRPRVLPGSCVQRAPS